MSARCNQVEPFIVPTGRRLPADSWLAGATSTQAQRCRAVGKRVMSVPISAIITSAVVLDTPVIEHKMMTAASKGHSRSVISVVRVAILNYGADRAVSSPPEWKMPGSGQ
jgi:hypothetical protein